ncbi:Uncharacterised protein [uncultured archaeon]|nr:Uncharacterised protein [uncultured archaeon]
MKRVVFEYTIVIISFLAILGITLFFSLNLVNAESSSNMTMKVKVDLTGFNSSSTGEISIWVPDSIDLGEVDKTDLVSDEVGIYINNTGGIDIRVTPELKDSEEEIFKYLYFRKQKSTSTNNTDLVSFKKIGDYYLDIDKPMTGKKYRAEHAYMQLNLSDFEGDIKEDVNDYNADIIFIATAR